MKKRQSCENVMKKNHQIEGKQTERIGLLVQHIQLYLYKLN